MSYSTGSRAIDLTSDVEMCFSERRAARGHASTLVLSTHGYHVVYGSTTAKPPGGHYSTWRCRPQHQFTHPAGLVQHLMRRCRTACIPQVHHALRELHDAFEISTAPRPSLARCPICMEVPWLNKRHRSIAVRNLCIPDSHHALLDMPRQVWALASCGMWNDRYAPP